MKTDPFDKAAATLAQDPRVEAVYGFGSGIRGTAGPHSDIDLAVLLNQEINLLEELRLRATVVETLRRDDVDLVRLNRSTPLLRYEVLATGRRLFTRDIDAVAHLEIRWLQEYLDTHHLRAVQRQLARERSHDVAA